MEKLIKQRADLLAQYDALKKEVEDSKRSAFTNDEREKANEILINIQDLDKQIAIEKEMVSKRNVKFDLMENELNNVQDVQVEDKTLVRSFGEFLQHPEGKFEIPLTRSTITTAANPQYNFQDGGKASVIDSSLILAQIGVPTFYYEAGEQGIPSFAEIVGTFGTEDNANSDSAFAPAKVTLKPEFVSASVEVSKKWLKSSKPENIQLLMDKLKLGIDKAVEKRGLDSLSTLTAIASGATGFSTTFHNAVLAQEQNLIGVPSAYIFSASGVARAKKSKVGTDQTMVMTNGMINGYPAYRSTLQSNANHGYLIHADAMQKAFWGDIAVEVVTSDTLARKGNVLIIATANADASYVNPQGVAVIKNVNLLS